MRPQYITFSVAEDGFKPRKWEPKSAGWDLYSAQDVEIQPMETVTVDTFTVLRFPRGYYGQLAAQWDLALQGLMMSTQVIEWNHQGTIKIIFHNIGSEVKQIKKGDAVAKIVIVPFDRQMADELRNDDDWTTSDVQCRPEGRYKGCSMDGYRCPEHRRNPSNEGR